MNDAVIKHCQCGRRYDRSAWIALEYVGIQRFDADEIPDLELRNCKCGSTLAINSSVKKLTNDGNVTP